MVPSPPASVGRDGLAWVPTEPSILLGAGTPGSCAENGKRLFFAYAAAAERVCFRQHEQHLIFLFSLYNKSFLPASRAWSRASAGESWVQLLLRHCCSAGTPAPAATGLRRPEVAPQAGQGAPGAANPAKPPARVRGKGETCMRPSSPSISFQVCSPSIKSVKSGFLRHIKGDSDVSHGEATYFSGRRN